ncbi:MAG TPA: RNA polymerase factor sigma-54 [Terriglobales bacterium]|jgi:RNA polymerase sigma-54 factor|nr:RNA polymerase factor sigma-54 [Terriglobales bacterium]
MVLLQPKLNVRLSQKQVLTPGLVQMVSVLALNKLELRDMITAEMVENPVLEELEASVPLLDEVSQREEDRDRLSSPATAEEAPPKEEAKDPFDEVDFGAYFQEYLDPGYRSRQEWEDVEKPSFENFLSRPATLTDHLIWQLSAMRLKEEVAEAAELVIGNLNEEGYLTASEDELMGVVAPAREAAEPEADMKKETSGISGSELAGIWEESPGFEMEQGASVASSHEQAANGKAIEEPKAEAISQPLPSPPNKVVRMPAPKPNFSVEQLREAIQIVQQMDPVGVAARDLRECLLAQVHHHQQVEEDLNGEEGENRQLLADCEALLSKHIKALQKKEFKDIAKAMGRPPEAVMQAVEYIKRLDPRPGLRYNIVQARLIEPDVAIFKQGDDYMVLMNDEDLPQLRLNPAYKKLLHREAAEKDVRVYVKERYKSAIQLIKNIEQRKQTILKVCYAIIRRQRDFLDFGMDQLKPMMIKDVAEEIGVHPSTVSRAVASKYAHTPQGVFELRYFFSESVNGPEGEGMSLLILKRKVKKLIEEEDPSRPLTDEQITRILQSQGIQVTRRTVAKYREDMRIPSTHQRRVKD